eukprot:969665-Pleurochrysis_carterae.AAC.1
MEPRRLPVQDAAAYAGSFPKFTQPKEVACFSRSADRQVHFDRSALRSYRPPSLPAQLDVGYESYVPKESSGALRGSSRILGSLCSRFKKVAL